MFSLCGVSKSLGLRKAPGSTAAFNALKPRCILCFLNLYLRFKDRFQLKCFTLHCVILNSFSSHQEIEKKNELKRKSSAAVVSSHLKPKVFHRDSLKWPEVTWVFQVQEDKTVTAFLPQWIILFLFLQKQVWSTATEVYGKAQHSYWWETSWPRKGNTLNK